MDATLDSLGALIDEMGDWLLSGKIAYDQIPIDNILLYLSEQFKRVDIDGLKIVNQYEEQMRYCVKEDDAINLGMTIKNLMSQAKSLEVVYRDHHVHEQMYESITKAELYYYRNYMKNAQSQMTKPSFSGKGAVYSAIIGGYDSIRLPEYIDEELDYYLFTDNHDVKSEFFEVIYVDNEEELDSARLSKKIKIIGNWEYLKEYDFTIWLDGKLQITGDLHEYMKKYSMGKPLLCFNHYTRDDLYQEGVACMQLGKDDPDIINAQLRRYLKEGFPQGEGLIDACLLVKDNRSELLKRTMYDWWNEVKNGSKRDQLSFSYVCWKNGLLYDTSPLISILNPYVKTYTHL